MLASGLYNAVARSKSPEMIRIGHGPGVVYTGGLTNGLPMHIIFTVYVL